jgi:hypothetical protein
MPRPPAQDNRQIGRSSRPTETAGCLVSQAALLYTDPNSNRFAARLPGAQERQP